MRVNLTIDLGEVDIETNSEHFVIDRVMFEGKEYGDKPAADLVLAMIGGHRKLVGLANIAIDRYKDDYKEPDILLDEEELFGTPV